MARLGTRAVFDAHGPALADATLDLAVRHRVGAVLPARWGRSIVDAARLRDGPGTIRVVKGEWADPVADPQDVSEAYLALIAALAGRAGAVAVATHDPVLAARSLALLRAAQTPCWLEQLRGLPGGVAGPWRVTSVCRFASMFRSGRGGGLMRSTRRWHARICRCGG
jgi:proline dehydrogenase